MAPHTVTLVNSGVTGDVLDLARVEVESMITDGRYGNFLRRFTTDQTVPLVHPCPPQLLMTPPMRYSGDSGGFPLREDLLSTTRRFSTSTLRNPGAYLD